MALNWQWKDKCGELQITKYEKKYNISLYEGNAYLIMVREYKDEKGDGYYELYNFFADKTHMKRCLGLEKGYTNIFADEWLSIRINKVKFRHTKELVSALAQAFDNITIEIYKEETE